MFTRGHAKHPCKQIKYSQRFAVRPIRPYPCDRIRLRGGPLCTVASYLVLWKIDYTFCGNLYDRKSKSLQH